MQSETAKLKSMYTAGRNLQFIVSTEYAAPNAADRRIFLKENAEYKMHEHIIKDMASMIKLIRNRISA